MVNNRRSWEVWELCAENAVEIPKGVPEGVVTQVSADPYLTVDIGADNHVLLQFLNRLGEVISASFLKLEFAVRKSVRGDSHFFGTDFEGVTVSNPDEFDLLRDRSDYINTSWSEIGRGRGITYRAGDPMDVIHLLISHVRGRSTLIPGSTREGERATTILSIALRVFTADAFIDLTVSSGDAPSVVRETQFRRTCYRSSAAEVGLVATISYVTLALLVITGDVEIKSQIGTCFHRLIKNDSSAGRSSLGSVRIFGQ